MDRVWLKHYPPGVNKNITIPTDVSLVSLLTSSCHQYANRAAFSCMDEKLTYSEWYKKSEHFAAYLQQVLGIKKGDRVAIMMPNILQYPVTLLAVLLIGGVVVNLNPLDKALSIQYELQDSGARVIVILENFVSELQQVIAQTRIEKVILTSVGALFSPMKRIITNFVVRHIKQMVPPWHLPHAIRFRQVLRIGAAKTRQSVHIAARDLAFLQYTGGTTGRAKGVMLSHANIVANLHQAQAWVSPKLTELQRAVVITALPIYHIFSLTINCLLFTWLGGENVLIPNPQDLPTLVKSLRKGKFHCITGVNTLFNALNQNENFKKIDFTPLQITLGGGMAIQKSVAKTWYKITGSHLTQAYGLTEASPAVTACPLDAPFDGTVGQPLPHTDVKIVDADQQTLAIGQEGELCVKGPQVMQGYWRHKDTTQEALVNGWLYTGDIAKLDERGCVTLLDRKNDLIIVSGFNVYPAEVEDVIMQMDAVQEVGVVGASDETLGQVIKAYVTKKPGSALTAGQVIAYCHRMLAAYKSPRVVEFVDKLPKSFVGKILRRELPK